MIEASQDAIVGGIENNELLKYRFFLDGNPDSYIDFFMPQKDARLDELIGVVDLPPPSDTATWARTGNTDDIPADKLGNVPAGGGLEMWTGTAITAATNVSKDTGIIVPSDIADDDIFTIIVDNDSVSVRSGSLTFRGKQLTDLTITTIGTQDPASGNTSAWLTVFQGNQDGRYFIGRTAADNIIISSWMNVGDNVTVTLVRFG